MDYKYVILRDKTVKIAEYIGKTTGIIRTSGNNAFKPVTKKRVESNIVIPTFIEGYPVSILGSHLFNNAKFIESVVIPDSVTNIEQYAFIECYRLKEVKLSKNLIKIGDSAFYGIPVESIVIPGSTQSIGSSAFDSCVFLKKLTIEDGVEEIDTAAFNYCPKLEEINIPKSVVNIRFGAFTYISSVEKITVDPKNKIYDSRNNCNAIIETETNKLIVGCKNTVIPEDVESIENCAFMGNYLLTKINIPDTVKSIGNRAFKGCKSLKKITFPKDIEKIGSQVISACVALETIEFKDITKLKSFFRNNFDFLTNLKEVIIHGEVCKKVARVFVEYSLYSDNDIFIQEKILDKLTKKDLENVIEEYKKRENAPQMQMIIQIYNKKYGKNKGPNLKI